MVIVACSTHRSSLRFSPTYLTVFLPLCLSPLLPPRPLLIPTQLPVLVFATRLWLPSLHQEFRVAAEDVAALCASHLVREGVWCAVHTRPEVVLHRPVLDRLSSAQRAHESRIRLRVDLLSLMDSMDVRPQSTCTHRTVRRREIPSLRVFALSVDFERASKLVDAVERGFVFSVGAFERARQWQVLSRQAALVPRRLDGLLRRSALREILERTGIEPPMGTDFPAAPGLYLPLKGSAPLFLWYESCGLPSGQDSIRLLRAVALVVRRLGNLGRMGRA
ncbi:hypothetical protein DFP72DRAFT_914750 [Ephemerocybe angulata]|uniref:Uncharacterized protein n=1 Tax=Ephemerocybe angulata TaxID=980116 RepID=A0A8H6HM34_9AGAR|nr:hypothetical protein DFP72DRAFT_914750 [Tulosesus angulatus]